MNEDERAAIRYNFERLGAAFYRCPTDSRVILAMAGDDKAPCTCRRSNPEVPHERAEQTGVHHVRYLTPATADEYIQQQTAGEED